MGVPFFMLIKIENAKPSESDVTLEVAKIVEAEYAKERAEAAKRDATARWVAQNLHDGRTTVLGKCIAVIPLLDDLRLQDKYGDHVRSKEFLRYYQKHHKEMCPSKI